MSGTERRVSATEARVRFGELLDGVTARHDVVFVERAGKEVAVVVSVEDWEAACASRSNKWTRANAMLTELHEPVADGGRDRAAAGVRRGGGHPCPYDAHYAALAERFRVPLWTCDRRLAAALGDGYRKCTSCRENRRSRPVASRRGIGPLPQVPPGGVR
jgi:prevent-host-death family protein